MSMPVRASNPIDIRIGNSDLLNPLKQLTDPPALTGLYLWQVGICRVVSVKQERWSFGRCWCCCVCCIAAVWVQRRLIVHCRTAHSLQCTLSATHWPMSATPLLRTRKNFNTRNLTRMASSFPCTLLIVTAMANCSSTFWVRASSHFCMCWRLNNCVRDSEPMCGVQHLEWGDARSTPSCEAQAGISRTGPTLRWLARRQGTWRIGTEMPDSTRPSPWMFRCSGRSGTRSDFGSMRIWTPEVSDQYMLATDHSHRALFNVLTMPFGLQLWLRNYHFWTTRANRCTWSTPASRTTSWASTTTRSRHNKRFWSCPMWWMASRKPSTWVSRYRQWLEFWWGLRCWMWGCRIFAGIGKSARIQPTASQPEGGISDRSKHPDRESAATGLHSSHAHAVPESECKLRYVWMPGRHKCDQRCTQPVPDGARDCTPGQIPHRENLPRRHARRVHRHSHEPARLQYVPYPSLPWFAIAGASSVLTLWSFTCRCDAAIEGLLWRRRLLQLQQGCVVQLHWQRRQRICELDDCSVR